jgi:hypothetical protein
VIGVKEGDVDVAEREQAPAAGTGIMLAEVAASPWGRDVGARMGDRARAGAAPGAGVGQQPAMGDTRVYPAEPPGELPPAAVLLEALRAVA